MIGPLLYWIGTDHTEFGEFGAPIGLNCANTIGLGAPIVLEWGYPIGLDLASAM